MKKMGKPSVTSASLNNRQVGVKSIAKRTPGAVKGTNGAARRAPAPRVGHGLYQESTMQNSRKAVSSRVSGNSAFKGKDVPSKAAVVAKRANPSNKVAGAGARSIKAGNTVAQKTTPKNKYGYNGSYSPKS